MKHKINAYSCIPSTDKIVNCHLMSAYKTMLPLQVVNGVKTTSLFYLQFLIEDDICHLVNNKSNIE